MKRYKFKLRGYDVKIKPHAYFPNEVWVVIGKSFGPFFKTYEKVLADAKHYEFDYLRIANVCVDLYELQNELEKHDQRKHAEGIEKLERFIEESEGRDGK